MSGTGVSKDSVLVTQEGIPTLSVTKDTLIIDGDINITRIFNIFSNNEWILKSNQSWLSLSITTSGTLNDTATIPVTITATANTSSTSRVATIIVNLNELADSAIVKVTQAAGPSTGVIDITGIDITLYPNPVTCYLKISIPNLPTQTSIIIYDLNGIEVYSSNVSSSISEVDMTRYSPGVYIVKIISPVSGIVRGK